MAEAGSFLEILKREWGDGPYPGDEHGGAAGSEGQGPPQGVPGEFWFATGIECSYPMAMGANGSVVRRDLLEECGHYKYWQTDLNLVRDLGLRYLRYGLPYHRVSLARDRYDWEFADLVMAEMRRLGITPILDLLHFGVPDWLGSFQNPELPVEFARYARAVAARYPWVRFYTPVNEIYVAARYSGKEGLWNERLKTDRGFVTALKHLAAANILAQIEIATLRPDMVIVQSESAEFTHDMRAVVDPMVTRENKLRFLSLDLLYAHLPDTEVGLYMIDNGLTRDEYDWFMKGQPPGYQVMGNDYYGRNEHLVLPDGSRCEGEDVAGWYGITRMYYERYLKPVMHTETNVFDPEKAPIWLWKQFRNIMRMREDNIPVVGFTWYSLTDQVDWDITLAEKRDKVNECGLYDLDRNPRPVSHAYRQLLAEHGHIGIVPRAPMLALTDRPADLKMQL